MARVKLTAGRIREFSLPEGRNQAFLWDTEARKLSVRITSKVKAFVFQSRLTDGKELRLTIGDSRDWSIEQAREEARRLQTTIDQGEDPRELRRQKEFAKVRSKAAAEAAKIEDEHRQCFTLQALCDAYVAALESKGKDKSARETRSVFKTHVLGAHPEIAKLPAREVTARQLAGIIRKVHEDGKQRTAGILRSYLSAAFNAAKKSPYDAKLPAELISFNIQSNPVDNIPAIPVGRGNRTLSEDELRAYMAGFGRDLADKALNLALLAGGQRMAQLLRVSVADWNPNTQTLRLTDPKGRRTTAREHLLPLAPKGVAIVSELVRRAALLKTEWLFSSTGKVAMTFETPGKRCAEISTGIGGASFDLRDIRRTVETMLAGMGISKDVRAQLLSHGISGVQSANYDRHDYVIEKRAALVAWENHLTRLSATKRTPRTSKRGTANRQPIAKPTA